MPLGYLQGRSGDSKNSIKVRKQWNWLIVKDSQ